MVRADDQADFPVARCAAICWLGAAVVDAEHGLGEPSTGTDLTSVSTPMVPAGPQRRGLADKAIPRPVQGQVGSQPQRHALGEQLHEPPPSQRLWAAARAFRDTTSGQRRPPTTGSRRIDRWKPPRRKCSVFERRRQTAHASCRSRLSVSYRPAVRSAWISRIVCASTPEDRSPAPSGPDESSPKSGRWASAVRVACVM